MQPLDLDPVAVTEAISLFQFMAGQLIILPFQSQVLVNFKLDSIIYDIFIVSIYLSKS